MSGPPLFNSIAAAAQIPAGVENAENEEEKDDETGVKDESVMWKTETDDKDQKKDPPKHGV